ncbi:MAG: porphobilinogen synthase [Verrucomicrobiota bacterium]|nr:porphobilinogen synthase [Verrucomicrobiota bacterium]
MGREPFFSPRRPRRNRQNASLRALVQETHLTASDLIAPLFVHDGDGLRVPISSMPGVFRFNIKELVQECKTLFELGIPAVALFPSINPSLKDAHANEAFNPRGLIPRAVAAIKEQVAGLLVITDVALDPYTDHGHDGLVNPKNGEVLNDETVDVLAAMAVVLAESGADLVAPSDMMDGRVRAIRKALDQASYTSTGILAYSIKFASSYYGPFREAVGSQLSAGKYLDKKTYQLNPANRREALLEGALDEEEGADILMVKPAGPYLDIIRELRNQTCLPIAAYQVSGEYAQVCAAAEKGWLNLESTRDESLLAIKRAGADMILTYFARDVATALAQA